MSGIAINADLRVSGAGGRHTLTDTGWLVSSAVAHISHGPPRSGCGFPWGYNAAVLAFGAAFAFGAGLSLVLPPPWVDAAVELDMAGTTILQTGTNK